MQLRSVETDDPVGTGSAPSETDESETVPISIEVDEEAPAGTYYLSADVCAATDCPTDQPRTSYRLANDRSFLAKSRIMGSEEEGSSSCVVVRTVQVE